MVRFLRVRASCRVKARKTFTEYVKMWDIAPRMDLLSGVEGNQAYLSASEGEKYVIYFNNGNKVKHDLRDHLG